MRRIEFGKNLILILIQDIDVTHINKVWSNLYLADITVSGIKIGTFLTLDTEIERRTLSCSQTEILGSSIEICTGESLGEIGYGVFLF